MSSIIIGSRGSSLALQQSHHIRNLLQSAHPHLGVEIKTIQRIGAETIALSHHPFERIGRRSGTGSSNY